MSGERWSNGGHVLWAALYGGALGLLRYKGKMSVKYLVDPLVLATFFGAVLLHTFWNLSGYAFLGILPDSVVLFLLKLDAYYVKYIMLIVFGWLLLLFIMAKVYTADDRGRCFLSYGRCTRHGSRRFMPITAGMDMNRRMCRPRDG